MEAEHEMQAWAQAWERCRGRFWAEEVGHSGHMIHLGEIVGAVSTLLFFCLFQDDSVVVVMHEPWIDASLHEHSTWFHGWHAFSTAHRKQRGLLTRLPEQTEQQRRRPRRHDAAWGDAAATRARVAQ